MAYLFDTDQVIDALADHPQVRGLIEHLRSQGVAMSLISYMEAYQGVLADRSTVHVSAKFDELLGVLEIVPFSTATARICANLRADLTARGRRVRPRALDLMTAATALEHGLTLVTRNTADFADIPGLRLYAWA